MGHVALCVTAAAGVAGHHIHVADAHPALPLRTSHRASDPTGVSPPRIHSRLPPPCPYSPRPSVLPTELRPRHPCRPRRRPCPILLASRTLCYRAPHLRCARSPVPAACSPLPRFHLASACASVLPRSFRPPTLPRCASVAPYHTLPRPYRPASALPPSRLPTPASASPHDHTAVASSEYPCRLPTAASAPPSLLPPRCATSALAHVCTHPLLSARSRAIPRRPSNTPRRRVRCA
jgi:hypothetical protein